MLHNATLNGQYDGLQPPDSHNISAFYTYGVCDGYPSNALTTVSVFYPDAASSGTIEPITVGDLNSSSLICFQACIVDETAGTGPVCGSVQSFQTPTVQTDPATNIGK